MMGVKFVILWQRGESVDFGGPSMMAGAIYEAVCQDSSCSCQARRGPGRPGNGHLLSRKLKQATVAILPTLATT